MKPSLSRSSRCAIAVLALVAVLVVGSAVLLESRKQGRSAADAAATGTVVVYKDAGCQCCSKWVDHLRQAGFSVAVENRADMTGIKRELGVPDALASCHTAQVGGYVIEGHVPAEDIHSLLASRPAARGLAVPGMPVGSPGMEVGERVDRYEVLLFGGDQDVSVFARHGPLP
jgi:hypothetical protein